MHRLTLAFKLLSEITSYSQLHKFFKFCIKTQNENIFGFCVFYIGAMEMYKIFRVKKKLLWYDKKSFSWVEIHRTTLMLKNKVLFRKHKTCILNRHWCSCEFSRCLQEINTLLILLLFIVCSFVSILFSCLHLFAFFGLFFILRVVFKTV